MKLGPILAVGGAFVTLGLVVKFRPQWLGLGPAPTPPPKPTVTPAHHAAPHASALGKAPAIPPIKHAPAGYAPAYETTTTPAESLATAAGLPEGTYAPDYHSSPGPTAGGFEGSGPPSTAGMPISGNDPIYPKGV